MKNCGFEYVVTADSDGCVDKAIRKITEHGFVCLRGIPKPATFESLVRKTRETLGKPSVLGSSGYFMKDCHKRIYPGFLVGPEPMEILLDERILEICESYLGENALLQEILVKHDLGDNELYFPVHAHTGTYRVEKKPGPFSLGIMLYVHDTEKGAFCFAPGTHKWDSRYGTAPESYPPEMQREITEKLCRIRGKAADIVLFDHRGFHGPEQPVTVPRTVYLGGFHSAEAHGGKVKCPTAVYAHDLCGLSERQLRVLGIKAAGSIIPKEKFHYFSFEKANARTYRFVKRTLEVSFNLTRMKWRWKRGVKSVLKESLGLRIGRSVGAQEAE